VAYFIVAAWEDGIWEQFDDLPYEILLKIFLYLSNEDLSLSTQNVSMCCRAVSQHNKLWRNAVFNPRKEITDIEIVKYLENMSALKSYSAMRETANIVIDTSCRSCRNIQGVELHTSYSMEAHFCRKYYTTFYILSHLKFLFHVLLCVWIY
jgi:hypothetical protein